MLALRSSECQKAAMLITNCQGGGNCQCGYNEHDALNRNNTLGRKSLLK
jgi:hypothetical protein